LRRVVVNLLRGVDDIGSSSNEDKHNRGSNNVVREDGHDTEPLEVASVRAQINTVDSGATAEELIASSRGHVVHHVGVTKDVSRTDHAKESDSTEEHVEVTELLGASGNTKDTSKGQDEEVNRDFAHVARTKGEEDARYENEETTENDGHTTILARTKLE